jgi:hypothetical protein
VTGIGFAPRQTMGAENIRDLERGTGHRWPTLYAGGSVFLLCLIS